MGCSYKGRIWAREPGSIPAFTKWCKQLGNKILDETIDPKDVLANVLIRRKLRRCQTKLSSDLNGPGKSFTKLKRVILIREADELPLSMFDPEIAKVDVSKSRIDLRIRAANNEMWSELAFTVGGDNGFNVADAAMQQVRIRIGRLELPVAEYLTAYPPLVRFVDLSELDGNVLFEPRDSLPSLTIRQIGSRLGTGRALI